MEVIRKELCSIEPSDIVNGSIVIPEGVRSIKNGLFSDMQELTSVVLPESLESIGENAFKNCINLKNIKLPKFLYSIGKSAFSRTGITSIELPDYLTELSPACFAECKNLVEVKLPNRLREIPRSSFHSCTALKSIVIPSNIYNISNNAFENCTSLKNVILENGVYSIGSSAFSNCTSIEKISLPESLKTLDYATFDNCTSLKTIKLSDNIEGLPSAVFRNCSSLQNINLPNKLEIINSYAFENCTSLTNFELPSSIRAIVAGAFSGCKNINSYYIPHALDILDNPDYSNIKYISYDGTGFKLTREATEHSHPFSSIKMSWKLIEKFEKYNKNIINEQKNPLICSFYSDFLSTLPEPMIEKFMNDYSFTFFKNLNLDLSQISNQDRYDVYKGLYNLGVFMTPIEDSKKSKTINYAQKITEFLKIKLENNIVSISDLKDIFFQMKPLGFNSEFTTFFINNFNNLIALEKREKGFIAKCYNDFKDVQKTNTSDRGEQRQLKATVEKFVDYFTSNKFTGITPENEHIAKTISPYYSHQEFFDSALGIFEEKQKNNTPDHILSVPLSEKQRFVYIDSSAREIENMQNSTLRNLTHTATNEFSYEWLSKNDPQNLILGKLCSCCSHLSGVGYGIMRASIIHPNLQNLVIRDASGEIVAKSTLYINPEEGYGVFNNVEIATTTDISYKQQIYNKYMLGIQDFAFRYNKEHPDKPLRQINVGMENNDLASQIRNNNQSSNNLLQTIDYKDYGTEKLNHSGDSTHNQYVVWKNEELTNSEEKSL